MQMRIYTRKEKKKKQGTDQLTGAIYRLNRGNRSLSVAHPRSGDCQILSTSTIDLKTLDQNRQTGTLTLDSSKNGTRHSRC